MEEGAGPRWYGSRPRRRRRRAAGLGEVDPPPAVGQREAGLGSRLVGRTGAERDGGAGGGRDRKLAVVPAFDRRAGARSQADDLRRVGARVLAELLDDRPVVG